MTEFDYFLRLTENVLGLDLYSGDLDSVFGDHIFQFCGVWGIKIYPCDLKAFYAHLYQRQIRVPNALFLSLTDCKGLYSEFHNYCSLLHSL